MKNLFKFKQIFSILFLLSVVTNIGAVRTDGECSQAYDRYSQFFSGLTFDDTPDDLLPWPGGAVEDRGRAEVYAKIGAVTAGLLVGAIAVYAVKKHVDARRQAQADAATRVAAERVALGLDTVRTASSTID